MSHYILTVIQLNLPCTLLVIVVLDLLCVIISLLFQILNMATGSVDREFALHTFPVKGIEWTGLNSILSHVSQFLFCCVTQILKQSTVGIRIPDAQIIESFE